MLTEYRVIYAEHKSQLICCIVEREGNVDQSRGSVFRSQAHKPRSFLLAVKSSGSRDAESGAREGVKACKCWNKAC